MVVTEPTHRQLNEAVSETNPSPAITLKLIAFLFVFVVDLIRLSNYFLSVGYDTALKLS
jgi:hypothetical protein